MNLSQNKQRRAGQSGKHSTSVFLQSFIATCNKQCTECCAFTDQEPQNCAWRDADVPQQCQLLVSRNLGRKEHTSPAPSFNSAGIGHKKHGPCLVAQGAGAVPRLHHALGGADRCPTTPHIRHHLPASWLPAPTNQVFWIPRMLPIECGALKPSLKQIGHRQALCWWLLPASDLKVTQARQPIFLSGSPGCANPRPSDAQSHSARLPLLPQAVVGSSLALSLTYGCITFFLFLSTDIKILPVLHMHPYSFTVEYQCNFHEHQWKEGLRNGI